MSRIRELRKQKGYKQTELAELIGADSTLISRWERGKSIPSSYYILKLSQILETSMDYLMGETDIPHKRERSRSVFITRGSENTSEQNTTVRTAESREFTPPGLDYWGGVVENARKAAASGKDLDLIAPMLREALNTIQNARVKSKMEDTELNEELAVVGI